MKPNIHLFPGYRSSQEQYFDISLNERKTGKKEWMSKWLKGSDNKYSHNHTLFKVRSQKLRWNLDKYVGLNDTVCYCSHFVQFVFPCSTQNDHLFILFIHIESMILLNHPPEDKWCLLMSMKCQDVCMFFVKVISSFQGSEFGVRNAEQLLKVFWSNCLRVYRVSQND